ncbi:MAG: hypothetical protein KDB10_12470 [Acidimicrobiales bacterium]|nr:hypothetical protein [Acidimicrobiales bacterium]MCB9372728.1 hypothetical protein [Microthrixaceae bacterium]
MDAVAVRPTLRPQAVGELLDAAMGLLKERPRAVLTVTAVFVLPTQLLAAFVQRDVLSSASFSEIFNDPTLAGSTTSSANTGLVFLAGLLPSMVLPFVAGALGRLVAAWQAGGEVSTGAALGAAGRKWWALLLAWLLTHLAEGVALLAFLFPAVLLMALWQVAAPAIVVEDLGPIRGLRRSQRLAGTRFWPVVLAVLAAGFVHYVLNAMLPFVFQLVAQALGADGGWIVLGVGGAVTNLVTTAFLAGFAVVLYLDLRVRSEGLDLQLEADRHFAGP